MIFNRFLFLCNLGFAIHSMLPNELDKQAEEEAEKDDVESVGDGNGNGNGNGKGADWEMQSIGGPASPPGPYTSGPFTPGPFTPRTTAFRTLDRKGPPPQLQPARFA